MNKPWARRNNERRKKECRYKDRLKRDSVDIPRYPGIVKVETGNGKHYYKKYYLSRGGGGSVKYYKRYAAKKTRLCAEAPANGSGFKKNFDLWWQLF